MVPNDGVHDKESLQIGVCQCTRRNGYIGVWKRPVQIVIHDQCDGPRCLIEPLYPVFFRGQAVVAGEILRTNKKGLVVVHEFVPNVLTNIGIGRLIIVASTRHSLRHGVNPGGCDGLWWNWWIVLVVFVLTIIAIAVGLPCLLCRCCFHRLQRLCHYIVGH